MKLHLLVKSGLLAWLQRLRGAGIWSREGGEVYHLLFEGNTFHPHDQSVFPSLLLQNIFSLSFLHLDNFPRLLLIVLPQCGCSLRRFNLSCASGASRICLAMRSPGWILHRASFSWGKLV